MQAIVETLKKSKVDDSTFELEQQEIRDIIANLDLGSGTPAPV